MILDATRLIDIVTPDPSVLVPHVGMGATIRAWEDRIAGTVIAVSASGRVVRVQEDKTVRAGDQPIYLRNPQHGRIWTFRLTADGWREHITQSGGYGLVLGERRTERS